MPSPQDIETEPVERVAYKIPEAAASIGISVGTLNRWTAMPGFPVVRIGGCVVIPKRELRDWLAEQVPNVTDEA